jgi:hypothetical protein
MSSEGYKTRNRKSGGSSGFFGSSDEEELNADTHALNSSVKHQSYKTMVKFHRNFNFFLTFLEHQAPIRAGRKF